MNENSVSKILLEDEIQEAQAKESKDTKKKPKRLHPLPKRQALAPQVKGRNLRLFILHLMLRALSELIKIQAHIKLIQKLLPWKIRNLKIRSKF